MKYCSNCGHQLYDGAMYCAYCGQAVGSAQPQTQFHPSASASKCMIGTRVKPNLTRLWVSSMLGGVCFGIIMGIMYVLQMGALGILLGIGSGLMWGGLFGLVMQLLVSGLHKKFAAKRAEISAFRRIIIEGGANLNGNGGWLFVTSDGVEYYTHKMNFSNQTLKFSNYEIQSISKEGGKLVIVANNTKYKFVVDYVDTWLQFCRKP